MLPNIFPPNFIKTTHALKTLYYIIYMIRIIWGLRQFMGEFHPFSSPNHSITKKIYLINLLTEFHDMKSTGSSKIIR